MSTDMFCTQAWKLRYVSIRKAGCHFHSHGHMILFTLSSMTIYLILFTLTIPLMSSWNQHQMITWNSGSKAGYCWNVLVYHTFMETHKGTCLITLKWSILLSHPRMDEASCNLPNVERLLPWLLEVVEYALTSNAPPSTFLVIAAGTQQSMPSQGIRIDLSEGWLTWKQIISWRDSLQIKCSLKVLHHHQGSCNGGQSGFLSISSRAVLQMGHLLYMTHPMLIDHK